MPLPIGTRWDPWEGSDPDPRPFISVLEPGPLNRSGTDPDPRPFIIVLEPGPLNRSGTDPDPRPFISVLEPGSLNRSGTDPDPRPFISVLESGPLNRSGTDPDPRPFTSALEPGSLKDQDLIPTQDRSHQHWNQGLQTGQSSCLAQRQSNTKIRINLMTVTFSCDVLNRVFKRFLLVHAARIYGNQTKITAEFESPN